MMNLAKLKFNQWYCCEECEHSIVRKKYFLPQAAIAEDSCKWACYSGLYFSMVQYPDGTSQFKCYDDETVYLDGTEILVPCEPPVEAFKQFTEECAQLMFNTNRDD